MSKIIIVSANHGRFYNTYNYDSSLIKCIITIREVTSDPAQVESRDEALADRSALLNIRVRYAK